MSLPYWERGLKSIDCDVFESRIIVAPLLGAWIEIFHLKHLFDCSNVAPLLGAWIEIIYLPAI